MSSIRCAGCSRHFADAVAFEVHANGTRRITARTKRRCRTESELRALGMVQLPGSGVWAVKAKAPS